MERNNMKGPTVIEEHQGECSNPTVEIKIKTLDSQVYTLKVNKQVPVPALKEQIATVTGVLSEQQRLICRGKVLKDDQLLSAYHVEDGHTLHLVVRQPFQHSSSTAETATTTNRVGQVSHGVFLGTVNIPDQVDGGVPDLNRVFSSLLGTVGAGNFVPVSSLMENRATFISPAFQSPGQGSSGQGQEGSTHVSSRLDLNQPQRFADIQMESGDAVFRIPAASILRPLQHSAAVPDSLSTMLQYIDRMRNEFTFEGTSNQSRISSSTGSSETEVSGNRSGSASGVLISPAALAEVLQSTQQLLTQQTGQLLNQLAAQLECDARITDPEARNEIQSTAIRNGIMLQNLGALLLELGRSVMTLRMGQSPAESVVNAGPAVFISNSGPNPLMVQPLPFLPGSSFGSIPTAVSHQRRPADGTFPAGISAMVDVNEDQSDQASTQSSTPGRSHVRNIPSLFGENSSVRVVPLRTVMAVVPSALSGRVSEASGGGLGVFYPFLARLQHLNSSQSNQARSRNDTEAVHLESQDARAFSNDEDQMQVPSSMQSGRQHDGNQEASRLSSIRSSTPRVPELGQERANPRSYIIEVGAHNVSVVNGDGSNNTLSGETSSSTQLYDAVGRFLNNMLSGGEASIGRRVTFDFMSDLQNASRNNSSRRTTEQAGETSIAATGLLGQTLHGISFNTENGRDSVVESDISLGFSGMHQQRTPADPEGLGSIFGVEISGFPEPEANSSGHDVEMEQHTLNDQDTLNDQHNSANETAMEIERSQDEDLRIFGQNIQVDENSPPNKRQKTE